MRSRESALSKRSWCGYLALFLAIWSLSGCYVLRQASYQNKLYKTRRPVSDVLEDSTIDAQLRANLSLTQEISAFAQAHGLNAKGAYGEYVHTEDRAVSYLVQAAEPDSLTSVTWWFPVVGRVPYLGYFSKDERDEKAAELRKNGKDVALGTVGAFSSLGWFEDPIYRPMLDYKRNDIVHIFLHELTHRTIWISGSPEFNEHLAEFVGHELTVEFLTQKGWQDDLIHYDAAWQDKMVFKRWLVLLKADLKALYERTPKPEAAVLAAEKSTIFSTYVSGSKKVTLKDRQYVDRKIEWNNATVLGESLYSPDMDRFRAAKHCFGDSRWGEFLSELKQRSKAAEEPFKGLDTFCSKQ